MEKQIEAMRCSLAQKPDFNLYQTFKAFDLEE
jgi:hypothetical protein